MVAFGRARDDGVDIFCDSPTIRACRMVFLLKKQSKRRSIMKSNTVKGTRDYLPKEVELREFIQRSISETYKDAGFNQIVTPILESIENLDNSEGGDNLSLMFRVLKRGAKLKAAIEQQEFDALCDIGLRYDLTVPLSRYYANNRANLISPMKCIQIGNAYRADNPQRGRYREFIQCDIDILGVDSYWAEVELIAVTAEALTRMNIGDFRVRINDRQILRQLFLMFGFDEREVSSLCVIFDKLDKIGSDGIELELCQKGFDSLACTRFIEYIRTGDFSIDKCTELIGESEFTESIKRIIKAANQIAKGKYRCEFDITLVRGQGYYTGAVFEIESLAYSGSLAGGGRYDNLIGKFVNERIPAVGFSIGLERIYDLLLERNFIIPRSKPKVAIFFETEYTEAYTVAQELKDKYCVSIFEKPQKLGKFLNRLQGEGYVGFWDTNMSQEMAFFKECR